MVHSQNKFSKELTKYVEPTCIFIKGINDVFDELECKSLFSKNPLKCPLKKIHPDKIKRLRDQMEFMKSLRLPNNARVYCIEGYATTIASKLRLCEELFSQDR